MSPLVIAMIVIVLLVILLVAFVAMRPPGFVVTRSTTIAAPAETVFAEVNDFHRWRAWSPWEKIDPNLTRAYGGPSAGVGTTYAWVGNKKVGEGRMTITESRPSDLIRIRLEFLKPFKSTNVAEWTFKPEGGGTKVTWIMTGESNFICKAFSMVINMDRMIGKDFEKGLAGIKSVVEKTA